MALAAMVVCLEMSPLGWKCGAVEETAMVLRAAAGHVKEKEWEAWAVGNAGEEVVGGARVGVRKVRHGGAGW